MRTTLVAAMAAVAMWGWNLNPLAADVPLTVKDCVGAARKAEPVSTGVCFKPGEVKDAGKLALFAKDGQPVPAQFLPIVKLEDGSIQWALLDFQADCPANGSAEFVVKPGAPAAAKQPVKVIEAGGVYTLNTGPLEVTIDAGKGAFELISSVKLDGQPVAGGAGGSKAMTCRDALDGNKLYHAGKPTKVGYDWKGPMRTTLVLEGPYVDDAGKEWLAYRVRVSVFAGSKLLRVEHELRNSCPTEARTVKVKDAFLRLVLTAAAGEAKEATDKDFLAASGGADVFVKHRLLSGYFSPGLHRLAVEDKTLVMAVVPTYEGGFDAKSHKGYNNQDKDKNGKPADYNPGDTGSWWLIDCAYKVDEYWLGFGAAASATPEGGCAMLAKGLDSRLYALAPVDYYSDCQALGFGPFGTLEDEEATYAAWGWKNGAAKKAALLGNEWMKARPEYHVASDLVHDETETDDAEGCLLMGLRTGGRGFIDAGMAWSRYYTNNFVARTDFPENARRGPGRKLDAIVVGNDFDQIVRYGYGYGNGRTCGCHFYGGGAMDYYVLTGEKSLLLGCYDLIEYTHKWAGLKPGKDAVGAYGSRGFGRQFLAVIRFYEITRDPEAKQFMDHMAQLAINEPNMIREDDWCFINAPSSNAAHGKKQVTAALAKLPRLREYMDKKGLKWDEASCTVNDAKGAKWPVYDAAGSWEQTYVQQAMERYHRVTGNKAAGDYVVKFANYFRKFAWNEHCQNACYIVWGIHFPEKGMCLSEDGRWDPAHDACPGPGAKHNGWYSSFGPDVAIRAYIVSKDKKYLDQAKSYWNRGSKLGYWVAKQSAADDEVGNFAMHLPPKDDSILSTALMFHVVPRVK